MVIHNALNAMKARKLAAGKFADGQGLWLHKRDIDKGKWILRLAVGGRRREMGLGRWPDVTIAEARERAAEARKQLRTGKDPIEERLRARHQPGQLNVETAIQGCFEARQAELKNDGHAGRWMSPLTNHVIPKIGGRPIEAVDQHLLKAILSPIWHKKPDVASKALNRLNLTLKHAAALGMDVDLQAPMKAKALLGKQRHTVTHIPSLAYHDAPAFYNSLCESDAVSALALRFLMLTVARVSEIRLATYSEVDDNIWVIPASRTKTQTEHRIPLTEECMNIIHLARESATQQHLFVSSRGKPLSDMAMSKYMRDKGMEARPHGFRATFRTWVEEQTNTEFEVKEAALGHAVDGAVVRAYQRSDRLEKRRRLMAAWNDYLVDPKITSEH